MKRVAFVVVALLIGCSSPRRSNNSGSTADAGKTSSDSGTAGDSGTPVSSDGGGDGGPNQLTLASIAPSHGQPGDIFTIDGMNIASAAQVFFGSTAATGVTVTSDGVQATGTVPAQPSGAPTTVSVTVQNAPGISATLADVYTYSNGALVTWCQIEAPTMVEVIAGDSTPVLSAQVYQANVTPGGGHANGLSGQLGFGSESQDVTSWTWADATYSSDVNNNDLFTGTVTPSTAGTYGFAFRFSLDSGASYVYCDTNGKTPAFSEAAAGTIMAVTEMPLTVTGISPAFLSVTGGSFTVQGTGLQSGATVIVGGNPATVTASTPTSLTVTAPAASAPGPQAVVVSQNGAMLTSPVQLDYVLRFTINVDGNLSDWPAAALVGTENPANSNWSSADTLSQLYMGYDDTNFYIGIQGTVEAQNTIIGYLNIGGLTWGSNDIAATLSDHSHYNSMSDLDDELSSVFTVADTTFLAHYGFGYFGGITGLNNGLAYNIGARQLLNGADLAWATSTASTTSTAAEFAIPWQTTGVVPDLFVPFPASPMTIRAFVRIVASDGTLFPTQGLPDDPNLQPGITNMTTLTTVSKVASIEVR